MTHDPVVIVSAARTPLGRFQGELREFQRPPSAATPSAPRSTARAWRRTGRRSADGGVLPAGQDRRPPGRRTAGRVCRMPPARPGQQGLRIRHEGHDAGDDLILARSAGIVVAGGMESMSNAPYPLRRRGAATEWGMIASSTT